MGEETSNGSKPVSAEIGVVGQREAHKVCIVIRREHGFTNMRE